jgi:hypothetical protein
MTNETPKPDPYPGTAHRTPFEEHAWWIHLDAWVTRLRRSHEHLWPPAATSAAHREHGRVRQRPWPDCWRGHPGLVHLLDALRAWHSNLVRLPLTDETPRAFVERHTVVERMLAREVQAIAKYCATGHRGPDVGPPRSRSHLAEKAHGPWTDLAGHPPQHGNAAQPEHRTEQERTLPKSPDHPSSEGLT